MEGSRDHSIVRIKPKVVIDKRFPFVNDTEVGKKGQMIAKLNIDSIRMKMEEDSNERKAVTLIIESAEPVNNTESRVV